MADAIRRPSEPRAPRWIGTVLCAAVLAVGCGQGDAQQTTPSTTATTAPTSAPPTPGTTPVPGGPRPDHIVVVVFENKAVNQLDGSTDAPYMNALMADSAVLTGSRAVAHPSQPNYLALFSGSTQDVTDNQCPLQLGDRPNLGRQLLDAGLTFTGYSEGLPSEGFTGCASGRYAAKHNPWVHFGNLPAAVNQPFTAFPSDYTRLPTVAFVIPDLCNDMHDCPVSTGDAWLRDRLDAYVRWARAHDSLLVVTFDEDDNTADNRILTFVTGAGVRPGRYGVAVDHYQLLSTMEDLYGLPRLGSAGPSLTDILS